MPYRDSQIYVPIIVLMIRISLLPLITPFCYTRIRESGGCSSAG